MSRLGDILELMLTAHRRFLTVRATVHQWQHHERSRRAVERLSKSGTSVVEATSGSEREPETSEEVLRLWIAKPSRMREEREGGHYHGSIAVRDGSRWWSYSPALGAMSSDDRTVGSGIGQQTEQMFDPAPLLGSLELELIGSTTVAGRAAMTLRALPRGRGRSLEPPGLFMLGAGADELELAVDAERGVLARTVARIDGEVFLVRELLEAAFDEDFPPETFVFVPPPGETIRAPVLWDHDLSVEEVARRAPFGLWALADLPTWVHYFPGDARAGQPASVSISYQPPIGSRRVGVYETAAGEQPPVPFEWDRIEHGGREYHVWKQQEHIGLRFDQEGTAISLDTAGLDVEALLELAGSLVRIET